MNPLINDILIISIPLLFAITVHEVAHGWMAEKLGDKTARMLGRITLNPASHIDPFGTILLPLMIFLASNGSFFFGYAKPVPISPINFKSYKRDMILVTLAGPISNVIMAVLWAIIAKLTFFASNPALIALGEISRYGIFINVVLACLNLLPIPPLDGSKVLTVLLPYNMSRFVLEYEQYSLFLIVFLVWSGTLSAILSPLIYSMMGIIYWIVGVIPEDLLSQIQEALKDTNPKDLS